MKTTDFARILSSFLLDELPMVRNQSGNTISSYRDTYVKLLTYFRNQLGVNPEKLNVSDMSKERISGFLNWLEAECGNSISTRNQRLAAIHSLFRYIQIQAPEYIFQCQHVLSIPYKKADKKQVGYLSEEETKTLLALPDTSTRKGRRDQMLLTLLYDSGARVQELADPLIPLRQHKRSPPFLRCVPELSTQEEFIHPAADIPCFLEGLVGDLSALIPFLVQADILIRDLWAVCRLSGLHIVFPELPHGRLIIPPDRSLTVTDSPHLIQYLRNQLVDGYCVLFHGKTPPLIIVRHYPVCPVYYHGYVVFVREVLYRI